MRKLKVGDEVRCVTKCNSNLTCEGVYTVHSIKRPTRFENWCEANVYDDDEESLDVAYYDGSLNEEFELVGSVKKELVQFGKLEPEEREELVLGYLNGETLQQSIDNGLWVDRATYLPQHHCITFDVNRVYQIKEESGLDIQIRETEELLKELKQKKENEE